jgi:branched-subunit amino acid transport protein
MINSSYFWTKIFLLAVGTIFIRISIIAASHKVKITARHKEIFSFIPAAVLPALTLPMVFYHQGSLGWLLGKERLVVLLLVTIFNYFVRSMTATIGLGLIALYLLTQS